MSLHPILGLASWVSCGPQWILTSRGSFCGKMQVKSYGKASKCRHLTGPEQNRNHRGFKAARKQAIKARRKARRINRSKT